MIYSHCILCAGSSLKTVLCIQEEGLAHKERDHKFGYSYKKMAACLSCGSAQIEIYSHDCYAVEEPWDMYWWYGFEESSAKRLVEIIKECPSPFDPHCECTIHQSIQQQLKYIYGSAPYAKDAADAEYYCSLRLVQKIDADPIVIEKDEGSIRRIKHPD